MSQTNERQVYRRAQHRYERPLSLTGVSSFLWDDRLPSFPEFYEPPPKTHVTTPSGCWFSGIGHGEPSDRYSIPSVSRQVLADVNFVTDVKSDSLPLQSAGYSAYSASLENEILRLLRAYEGLATIFGGDRGSDVELFPMECEHDVSVPPARSKTWRVEARLGRVSRQQGSLRLTDAELDQMDL